MSNPASSSSDRSDSSDRSVRSSASSPAPHGLRPSGGYRQLRSFQVTTIIYDGTVSFCERFVDKRSRTVDQMVQAARSGRQNIAEGSRASAASSQTELRLVTVARASLDELLLDYEDYLRQRQLRQWAKNDPEALAVRTVGRTRLPEQSAKAYPADQCDASAYAAWLQHREAAVVANCLICLIHQANYLLDHQVAALERDFIHEGGYSEKLAAARIAHRRQQDRPLSSDQSAPSDPSNQKKPTLPACPLCAKPMALRTARKGPNTGSQFLGCTAYPDCKGTRPLESSA